MGTWKDENGNTVTQVQDYENDERPIIICNDVIGLEIDHLKAPVIDGITAYKFDKVSKLKVENTSFIKEK